MARHQKPTTDEGTVALAASVASDGANDEVKQLAKVFLQKHMEEAERTKARKAAMYHNMVEAAKQEEAYRQSMQASCTHKNDHQETRLAGQQVSDGTVKLLCMRCQKRFSLPAVVDMPLPTPDLMPNMDFIGGATSLPIPMAPQGQ